MPAPSDLFCQEIKGSSPNPSQQNSTYASELLARMLSKCFPLLQRRFGQWLAPPFSTVEVGKGEDIWKWVESTMPCFCPSKPPYQTHKIMSRRNFKELLFPSSNLNNEWSKFGQQRKNESANECNHSQPYICKLDQKLDIESNESFIQFEQEAELGHHRSICQQDREDKEEGRPLTSDKKLKAALQYLVQRSRA